MNTSTLIPKMVSILNADIGTHLNRTADDLLHVLQGKRNILPPLPHSSVQGALIQISQLLNRDEAPLIQPLVHKYAPPLEGAHEIEQNTKLRLVTDIAVASEGATPMLLPADIPVFKTTIQPVILTNMSIHPELYNNAKHKTLLNLQ